MKAVRFHGKHDIRVDQVPVPACGSDEVLVCSISNTTVELTDTKEKMRPAFTGICGTGIQARRPVKDDPS